MKIEFYQLNDFTWVTLKNYNGISYYITKRKVGSNLKYTVLTNTISGRNVLKNGIRSLMAAQTEVEIDIVERSKK